VLCVFRTVKYYFQIEVEFERQVSDTDELQHTTAQFFVPLIISAFDLLDIHSVISSFQNRIESFTSRGSGWNVSRILNLSLSMRVFRPTIDDSNVLKKGVYPYEYVTGPEILRETCLPLREKIYSELNEEGI